MAQGKVSSVGRGPKAAPPDVDHFRADPLFPRIERAVAAVLANGKVVAPVDVLVAMQLLSPEHLEDWRRGRVPYLEQVIHCNLTRLSRLRRILRFHAHDLNLVPSQIVYRRHGKGLKQALRFTKTGDPNLEAAYARHFVWPGKRASKAPEPAGASTPVDENPRSPSPSSPPPP
jgi:hypothetical protein